MCRLTCVGELQVLHEPAQKACGCLATLPANPASITNPLLEEMLGTFLTEGNTDAGIDFDELGVSEVVDVI